MITEKNYNIKMITEKNDKGKNYNIKMIMGKNNNIKR